jgi:hypothetical protein
MEQHPELMTNFIRTLIKEHLRDSILYLDRDTRLWNIQLDRYDFVIRDFSLYRKGSNFYIVTTRSINKDYSGLLSNTNLEEHPLFSLILRNALYRSTFELTSEFELVPSTLNREYLSSDRLEINLYHPETRELYSVEDRRSICECLTAEKVLNLIDNYCFMYFRDSDTFRRIFNLYRENNY